MPVPGKKQGLNLGTKWTKIDPADREKHFELIELGRESVLLRCVVTRNKTRISRVVLQTSDLWRLGWH